jgi:hypothetical protein
MPRAAPRCWPGCRARGFDRIAAADGAFYLWCDVGHLTNDSLAFCAGCWTARGSRRRPGVDFDRDRGARFLRFSYCGPAADMAAAPALGASDGFRPDIMRTPPLLRAMSHGGAAIASRAAEASARRMV